ncbi:MAG: alanine--glyoxylate aminotransferase family protein [Acidimicrobiia bacterium]|nr:alanine--glyoxylate aminotransferase family protein [Acidimicrobiia bacterium]
MPPESSRPRIPDRLLLGPGPSPMAPRVMAALGHPVLSHLDPAFVPLLDEVRARLQRLFGADGESLALATPGTGTSGMEAAVANTVADGARVLVVVTGYFGDRLAQMCQRYGGQVRRLEVEWGQACDPDRLRAALVRDRADMVAFVHAETSTGVLNPARDLASVARAHGARTIADMVTSLGGHEVRLAEWGIDVAYSCTQKCIGSPSGLAPIAVSGPSRQALVPARSFYLDLALLERYWRERSYHHTLSASLVYALLEALILIDEEGLEQRWARHRRHHVAFIAALEAMGLSLLPAPADRLHTLHAVRVPDGVDEASVRRMLLDRWQIEIGGGLGPLAGRIWRVGLMGAGSTSDTLLTLLDALERALTAHGHRLEPGAGRAAATASLAETLLRE